MRLSSYLAQDIVEEMEKIIHQDLNYFDDKGYIIASTNLDRIGIFHEGAMKVLKTKKELVIEYDEQYKGSKKGINMPVYQDDEVVGVIGITGDKEEIGQYGEIIQRLTEVLIRDTYIREQRIAEEDSKKQFIEELLFRHRANEESIFMWAGLLGIRVDVPRCVLIGKIVEKDSRKDKLCPAINDEIFKLLKDGINYNKENLIAKSGMYIIIIYHIKKRENIVELFNDYIDKIELKYRNTSMCFGIGSIKNNMFLLKSSYEEAMEALDISDILKNKKISLYEDLDIGLILGSMPKDIMEKYTSKVLGSLDSVEIDEYRKLLLTYVNNNGSINKTADELYIHKNTLQYRLNKIHRITGYNPRNIRDMIVLYLAFNIFEYGLSHRNVIGTK